MIRAVIFDIYGTLIDIKSDESLKNKKLWEELLIPYKLKKNKVSGEELRENYLNFCNLEMEKVKSEYPDIEIRNVFKSIINKFFDKKYEENSSVVDELAWRFRKLSTISLILRDGVIELLEELRMKDYLLGIVSNTQDAFTWGELENFKIAEYFDAIVYSSIYGRKKPDILLFNECLKLLDCRSEEAVYIGNDPVDDVKGGKKSGMKVIYIGKWNEENKMKYSPDHYIKSGKILESLEFID